MREVLKRVVGSGVRRARSVVGRMSDTPVSIDIESNLASLKLGVEPGLIAGRSVYDGYQRGWGLQFGGLRSKILSDSLYQDAFAAARGRTVMSEDNRMNIFLILRLFLSKVPSGHIVEFGSYKGGSAIFMAYVARQLYPEMKVYAMDTFEGMPETDKKMDAHRKGDFSGVDLLELQDHVAQLKLSNLILVKGPFEETSSRVMREADKVALAHIDCDIAAAVQYSYESVKPHMVNGGYFVFDDATVSSCIGATAVVEDIVIRRDGLNSEQIWPHFVFRALPGEQPQSARS